MAASERVGARSSSKPPACPGTRRWRTIPPQRSRRKRRRRSRPLPQSAARSRPVRSECVSWSTLLSFLVEEFPLITAILRRAERAVKSREHDLWKKGWYFPPVPGIMYPNGFSFPIFPNSCDRLGRGGKAESLGESASGQRADTGQRRRCRESRRPMHGSGGESKIAALLQPARCSG